MEFLKGGHIFLNALPPAATALGQPLQVIFAGDGRERRVWEQQAVDVQRKHPE